MQKHVLYLGEINDSQREAWWRSIEIKNKPRRISLFPEDCKVQSAEHDIHVHVNRMRLGPRQWGACWMELLLWDQLQLDHYWKGSCRRAEKEPDGVGLAYYHSGPLAIPSVIATSYKRSHR